MRLTILDLLQSLRTMAGKLSGSVVDTERVFALAVCIRMEGSTSCSSFSASVLLLYQGGHLVLADAVLSTKNLSSFRVGQCVAYCKPLGAVLR